MMAVLLCVSSRTVFITGFPNDIKERELNNMLRFMPGYEASQMNWKNGQVRRVVGSAQPIDVAHTITTSKSMTGQCSSSSSSCHSLCCNHTLGHLFPPVRTHCCTDRHKALPCSTLEPLHAVHAIT